ncbi:ligand-binding sensor domain-containing protein [Salinimicrobium catena]|uniref:Ligand-binding sensor domain-containing protein n=1 Tax=Salinimicrobium catena TaxID=390640 RepID=A0A1H5I2Y8_9FLAO|nr:triple tyrosine motif-containing protein [Salinimicrobium catena]SDK74492.1 ligand-binding sensor domain-containing protein [Salinimicrobium catena]SEE34469.1 ligand-binding sensor domain-containing protein [Salinimicrobium catena]
MGAPKTSISSFFLSFLFMISLGATAQELPPVVNFDPVDYGAGNQNWMISQGEDKNIYVANSSGLMEYNGAEWSLYPMPNRTIVRSVKVVGEHIFTGAYMEVGYWLKQPDGQLAYTSLTDLFPKPIKDGEQFWHIESVGEDVVLQSFEGIYLFNTKSGEFSVLDLPAQEPVTGLYKAGNKIFFSIPEVGLFEIDNGKAKKVIPASQLNGIEIIEMRQINNGLEMVSRRGKFYRWEGSELETYNLELSEKLAGISLFSALQLEDGSLVLGSVENGLYITGRDGKIVSHFRQENGLNNNTVLSLFPDREGNVWTGLDNGISVINLDSPFKLFQDNIGRLGTVYTSLQTEDHLYLGTNQGLYFRKLEDDDFTFMPGTNGQVWSIQMVEGNIFVGHNNGTFLVEGEEAKKISDHLGTWTVKKYWGRKEHFIQGHYNGFSLLKREEEGFVEYPMVKDFPHSSRHIVTRQNGEIWIGNEHKGVFRILLEDSLRNISSSKNYTFKNTIGITSSIFEFNDTLYFSSRNKIFQYQKGDDAFSEKNELAQILKGYKRISGRVVSLENEIWTFGDSQLLNVKLAQLKKGYDLNSIFIPKALRAIPQGYENISSLSESRYLLGLVDGYLIFNQSLSDPLADYELRINRVLVSGLEEDQTSISRKEAGTFNYKLNNFTFQFGFTEYKKFLVPVYSYRLKGFNSRWSNWSPDPSATFKNLPFGDYTFEVRGKIGNELFSGASYDFEISRPWYLGNLAIATYVLLFFGFLFLVHLGYKREQEKRIRENEKNLRMRNLEAEKKIMELQNEQLEKEMAGKSKELAVSTMSLIKKNEFLTSIKQKLQETGSSSEVRSVIKKIDQDINGEDNWKFFKKAFSNADKDFFKKIKAKHPDLTSNDLKLCAYLRLNLSSKEIAPLLNISVKSVEIKRYRLRKKMDLPREVNLVDYILAI